MSHNVEPLLIGDLAHSKGTWASKVSAALGGDDPGYRPYDSNASEIFTVPPFSLPIEGQSTDIKSTLPHPRVRYSEELTNVPGTRLDSPPIDDNGRSVVSDSSHEAAGHVLVTSRNSDVSVVVLGLRSP
jgi:hypothetical protein